MNSFQVIVVNVYFKPKKKFEKIQNFEKTCIIHGTYPNYMCNIKKIGKWHLGENIEDGQTDTRTDEHGPMQRFTTRGPVVNN